MTKTSERPILKLKFSNLTSLPKQQAEIIKTVIQEKELANIPQVKLKSPKKLLSKEEFTDLLVKAREKYPKVFLDRDSPKVILAIGIHKELAKGLEISMTKARKICMIYCNQKSYKEARIPGAKRYDLEGNITGEILS